MRGDMTLSEIGWMADAQAALIEWSEARKGATPATPESWDRLARSEGRLQVLADRITKDGGD